MKTQYDKVAKLALQLRQESSYLDEMIDRKYGFSYSQTDDDRIIDTLDYGTDNLSYEEFQQKMNFYKNQVLSGKRTLNH